MSEHMEDIEARLTAYIDGELSGPAREEIERHLAANPTHLALVGDLMRHRQALRALPRETAPRDLMEELQGQLERETLLGGDEPLAEQTRLRVLRWPQILSMAAVVMLAFGLGMVIWKVMPRGKPGTIAMNTPAPGDRERAVEKALERDVAEESRDKRQLDEESPRGFGGGGQAVARGLRGDTKLERSGIAEAGPEAPGANLAGKAAVAAGPTAAGVPVAAEKTIYITIRTSDFSAANSAVVSYLTRNSIAWSETQEPLLEQLAEARGSMGREGAGEAALSKGLDENLITAEAHGIAAEPQSQARPKEGAGGEIDRKVEGAVAQVGDLGHTGADKPAAVAVNAPEQGIEPPAPVAGVAAADAKNEALASAQESEGAGGRERSRREKAFGTMAKGMRAAPAATEGASVAGGGIQGEHAMFALGMADKDAVRVADAGRVILAREMNARQVAELAQALSHPDRGEVVRVSAMGPSVGGGSEATEQKGVALGQLMVMRQQESDGAMERQRPEPAFGMARGRAGGYGGAPAAPTTQPADVVSANVPLQVGPGDPAEHEQAHLQVQQPTRPANNSIAGQQQLRQPAAADDPAQAQDHFLCVIVFEAAPVAPLSAPATRPTTTQPAKP